MAAVFGTDLTLNPLDSVVWASLSCEEANMKRGRRASRS